MKHHWQNGLVDSKYASTSSVPPRPVRSNVNYGWCLVGMRACTRVNVYTITSRVYTRLQNCTSHDSVHEYGSSVEIWCSEIKKCTVVDNTTSDFCN